MKSLLLRLKTRMKWFRSWPVFVGPLFFILILHWFLLGYLYPFGGQHADDDYHYYSFAARFDADNPFNLPAYQPEVPPDRVTDIYDRARLNVSFGNFWPYPGWTFVLHLLTATFGLSFPTGAFIMYIVQAALLLWGAQLLVLEVAAPSTTLGRRLAASVVVASFLGVQGIPTPLVSIPMNMAAALSLAALGLLISRREKAASALLLCAVFTHVAAVILVLFVLAVWTIYAVFAMPRVAWQGTFVSACMIGALVFGVWAGLYYGVLGMGATTAGEEIKFGFDLRRLDYLIRGNDWFLFVIGGVGLVLSWFAALRPNINWQLPAACLTVLAIAAGVFVFVGTNYAGYHTLHPVGRLMYLAPLVSLLVLLPLCGALIQGWRASGASLVVGLLCGFCLLGTVGWQDYLILNSQVAHRQAFSLGPLHAKLVPLATDPNLRRMGFVFFNHEFGTVLSAAHLYYGRYYWAKVYSPEQLQAATAPCDRLVYLEGSDDPTIRVDGFCVVSVENIHLGFRPNILSNPAVRMVQAYRC